MRKYYKERLLALKALAKKLAPTMEVNEILEKMREELRTIIPQTMEACILLLDPEAPKYTRPLQCALYDKPMNCIECKRNRPAVQKALRDEKVVVINVSHPIVRMDGTKVAIGPEAASPIFVNDDIVAIVNVVAPPGERFSKKDFYLLKDFSELAGIFLMAAKQRWKETQEKIRISQMLSHLGQFVPRSVRKMVEENPDDLDQEKELQDVSVVFLDLEGYTRLSEKFPETEVNEIIEKTFSAFVDPIHRSGGEINETAGDGLMIIFAGDDQKANAVNAVRAAFDIYDRNKVVNSEMGLEEPINVNIGINSGKALVGMTKFKGALETRFTYTATGPVTNVAARLADYAEGGDILIGEETKRLIDGLWPVYEMGEVTLKGIHRPLKVYSLIKKA